MPYTPTNVPSYVPKKHSHQWANVWNSAYQSALDDGKTKEKAEEAAFAVANGVAGPNAKCYSCGKTGSTVKPDYLYALSHYGEIVPSCQSHLHDTCGPQHKLKKGYYETYLRAKTIADPTNFQEFIDNELSGDEFFRSVGSSHK